MPPEPPALEALEIEREVACHAVNLFYEARNQSRTGRQWVLDVVTNRVDHSRFSDSVCGVVTKRRQFSWLNGKTMPSDPLDWVDTVRAEFNGDKVELAALELSFAMAREHILEDPEDRTGGSLYYMTDAGLKNMGKRITNYTLVASVQDHNFFNDITWR